MEIIKHEKNTRDHYFTVRLADRRQAFLRIDKLTHPLQVIGGDAAGCASIEDRHATLDEAGTWLLNEIRHRRVNLD